MFEAISLSETRSKGHNQGSALLFIVLGLIMKREKKIGHVQDNFFEPVSTLI